MITPTPKRTKPTILTEDQAKDLAINSIDQLFELFKKNCSVDEFKDLKECLYKVEDGIQCKFLDNDHASNSEKIKNAIDKLPADNDRQAGDGHLRNITLYELNYTTASANGSYKRISF